MIEPILPEVEVWSLNYWTTREVLLIPFKSIILILVLMFLHIKYRASLVAQTVKNLPVMQETWLQSLGWEDPLEKEMATHFTILAWRIPMDR